MNILITILFYLSCHTSMCRPVELKVTRESLAIATCESGDTVNYGTLSWTARSKTLDGGAFQFNDATYLRLNGYKHAEMDTPQNQYDSFVYLWDNGYGWSHWTASKKCWSKWLVINDNNQAVWRGN